MMFWQRWSRQHEAETIRESMHEDQVLVLPRAIIEATYAYILPYWRAEVETACFWFGVDTDDLQVVTTLATPRLYQSQGHYRVDRDSLRRLAMAMREQGSTNLAQVHTHPGSGVGHSPYDNDNAYSTRPGALSLVWPNFGRSVGHTLDDIGVHERRNGRWVHLAAAEVERRIRIVDSHADFRWEIKQERGDENA